MKIYYSKKTKKYYLITDELTISILKQIEEDSKLIKYPTVTQIAAEVSPDPQQRKKVYIRLEKLQKNGLIDIIRRINIKYIIPRFKEVHLFRYTTLLSIPLLVMTYTILLYMLVFLDPIHKTLISIVLLLMTIYFYIFFKERVVLDQILRF